VNVVGGVSRDVLAHADDILKTIDAATKDYKELMQLLLGSVSHLERLERTGRLSRDIARKLGVTGVAARASGLPDDMRKSHPHLIYDRLIFESHTLEKGDVLARMMIRAEETECSISMVQALFESGYAGDLAVPPRPAPAYASSLGYAESPRGSLFYWVMADKSGRPLRVKLRSPSYCNWPAVPFAVHGNIVPDFPLCNKSFNLSYSGTDM
jgi:Ni,Fe-hydrogenase III large subunit